MSFNKSRVQVHPQVKVFVGHGAETGWGKQRPMSPLPQARIYDHQLRDFDLWLFRSAETKEVNLSE
jgi:hypothetical protein